MAAASFAEWMATLDALQELRFRDPTGALAQVLALRDTWQGLSPAEDALLQARCSLQVAAVHLTLGEHAATRCECDVLDSLLRAPALQQAAPALRHQASRVAIAAGNARAFLAHSTGDFPGALRAYLGALDAALAIGDRTYQARLRVNLANTYEESGLPTQSLEESTLALALARELGMDELAADIHHNMGNALAMLGDSAQGLASNRAALQAYRALGLQQKQGYAMVAVAERLLELGRADDAAQALHEGAAVPVDYVNPQYKAYAAYLAGRISMAQARPDQARHDFHQALAMTGDQLGDRVGQARSQLQLAHIEFDAGQLDTAWAQGQLALGLLEGSSAHRDIMQTHQLLSRVAKQRGDLAAALRHHEAFHDGYALGFNEESARKASLLAVRHEVDLARGEAQRQTLENARLTEALAEIGERLRTAGGQPARQPGREPQPEDLRSLGLTPREAEVLYWVTMGKTNDDVSVILGLSMSAVKKHLGSIFGKLGVDNRTAAADAARRRQVR
jgi:DNA-binding CsgD family transcriptional regulator